MFGLVARFYDDEVDYHIEIASALLEPLLMGIVALLVGFVCVSLFLPLYGAALRNRDLFGDGPGELRSRR